MTLTYDATLSRVRVDADSLAGADYATVERSTDQVNWTVVRGGSEVGVTGGAFDLPVDDYEFSPDVANYYRVRGVSTDPITYVASGAGASNANAGGTGTLTPVLPAGLTVGDLLVAIVSCRDTAGRVVVPNGWTMMVEFDNVAFVGRYYQSGDVAPTFDWTGDAAAATLLGQQHAFTNAGLVPVTSASQANASTQDVDYPGLTVPADDLLIIASAWKQAEWAGAVDQLAGMTEIGDFYDTIGDDAGMATDYVIQTTAADITAGSFNVAGTPINAVSRGSVVALMHAAYLNEQTDSITPTLDAIWLKSIARPFLNQQVDVVQGATMTVSRPARSGVFDVVGRSLPIAVNDVRKSRRWTMQVRTETADARDTLTLLLASGDVALVQAPAACANLVPTGYVTVGDVDQTWHALRPLSVLHTLPVAEVAPPGPDVVGAAQTWATVLATYSSWSAVLAAHADWADLLTLIGDPSEVVVP